MPGIVFKLYDVTLLERGSKLRTHMVHLPLRDKRGELLLERNTRFQTRIVLRRFVGRNNIF